MFTLSNDTITTHLLDPVADRDRMGPRYCTGGYIFQVLVGDAPTLSGPTYPDTFNWFDGQGIPDSFARGALRSPDRPGPEALIPGIGVCDTTARTVSSWCRWDVEVRDSAVRFVTVQEWEGYEFRVSREVSIHGRVVRSDTRVDNLGRLQLPICWFPHPFFPPPGEDGALCRFPGQTEIPEGTTYFVGDDGYLRCRDLAALQSVPVACASSGPLTVLHRHRDLGGIAASFSFPAGHVLIWGNERTFSFEPYLEQTVGFGASLGWTVDYHF